MPRRIQEHNIVPFSLSQKIYVQVNVQLFRILQIDDSSENITLDLGISFMWLDPHVAQQSRGSNYSSHPQISRHKDEPTITQPKLWPNLYQPGVGAFDPSWKIENSSEIRIIKKICMVLDPSVGKVHQYIHLVAKIHHRLNMAKFPVDVQHFCFNLRSEHTVDVMEFIKFDDDREARIFDFDTSEWSIVERMRLTFDTGSTAAAGSAYAATQFHVTAARKPEWYCINVALVSFMIVLASFSTFCLEKEDISARLGIIFTTWLLLISLKFSISCHLPKISYFTYLDKYLFYSYSVMVFMVLYACIQKYLATFLRTQLVCLLPPSAVQHSIGSGSGSSIAPSSLPFERYHDNAHACSSDPSYLQQQALVLHFLGSLDSLLSDITLVVPVMVTAWVVVHLIGYRWVRSYRKGTWRVYDEMKLEQGSRKVKEKWKIVQQHVRIATVRSPSYVHVHGGDSSS